MATTRRISPNLMPDRRPGAQFSAAGRRLAYSTGGASAPTLDDLCARMARILAMGGVVVNPTTLVDPNVLADLLDNRTDTASPEADCDPLPEEVQDSLGVHGDDDFLPHRLRAPADGRDPLEQFDIRFRLPLGIHVLTP